MFEEVLKGSNIVREAGFDIYSHLVDDESRFFFEKRLAWWLTGDKKYLLDSIEGLDQKKTWDEYVEKCKDLGDRLIVYGACEDYRVFKELYPDVQFLCFCDRNVSKQKSGWLGKSVISPEVLLKDYRDHPILINASDYYEEIEAFLLSNGIPEANIYNKGKDIATKYPIQYFDSDILQPVSNEVFVDGGAYDMETARKFARWCGDGYKKIYSFEPDPQNYSFCLKQLGSRPIRDLELINKGTWNCEDVLSFKCGGEGSRFMESGDDVIEVKAIDIDSVVGNDRVTLLKLDVEGAELKALEGAQNTIRNNHPRLAISIYHKPEDIIQIPAYILSLYNDYKLYIRHYKFSYYETVLYAIP